MTRAEARDDIPSERLPASGRVVWTVAGGTPPGFQIPRVSCCARLTPWVKTKIPQVSCYAWLAPWVKTKLYSREELAV